MAKYQLKDLISRITYRDYSKYKKNTLAFIREAQKGVNWSEWNQDVFYAFFEQKENGVANLGNGQMTKRERMLIKEHWMELAPYLKEIADSQNVPLWDSYKKIREIIRLYTDTKKNIATNRMLASLQPNLLCSEASLEKVNEILNNIKIYTCTSVPYYNTENWEEASYLLLQIIRSAYPDKPIFTYGYIPWNLLYLFRDLINEGDIPNYWIFPWNPKVFYLHDYFKKFREVDWKQGNYKINVGDYVYIYCSKPEQRICYYLRVVKVNIPFEETIDDKLYWGENNTNDSLYCRLKLIKSIDTDDLCLNKLLENGLNTRPQGKQKINAELLSYIQSCFNGIVEKIEPTELFEDEAIYEGAKKTIIVNQYERNPIARQKCIDINGCKCKVCGMDFENKYGEIGRGFIHVHHVVPISTIGKTYQIDPVNDLVPVCPNCHAMLHCGKDGKVLSVEDLKSLLQE